MIHLQAKWDIDNDGIHYVTEQSKQFEDLTTELQDKLFSYFPNQNEFDFLIEYFDRPIPIPHDFAIELIGYFSERDKYIEQYFTH
jgi:hypothetical protein